MEGFGTGTNFRVLDSERRKSFECKSVDRNHCAERSVEAGRLIARVEETRPAYSPKVLYSKGRRALR